MPKLENMIGNKIGFIVVESRGPDHETNSDPRTQWKCRCTKCNQVILVQARALKSKNHKFKRGCPLCPKKNTHRGAKKGEKFGRNANGFIDRTNISEKEGGENEI